MCAQRELVYVPCSGQDEVFLSLCLQSEKNKRFNDLGPTVARTGFWKKDIEETGHHKKYEYFIHRLTSFIYTCFSPNAPADLFGLCRQIPIEIANLRGWQSNANGTVLAGKRWVAFPFGKYHLRPIDTDKKTTIIKKKTSKNILHLQKPQKCTATFCI